MNTYRKKNYRGKRGYGSRPHRRTLDNYHQPLPPDKEKIPYARHTLTKPDVEAVVEALLSGTLTQGRELERFESLLAKLTHSNSAIALNSGTAAIHAALACLKLEAGDEVITSTLNFSAVANMVTLVGAVPVLVDCDPETLTLSVEGTAKAVTENTKAVFTNNFGGHPSDLNALREICEEHNLVLLEDACHGLGGKYRGHYVGNQADITCFSFHPSKAVTTCEGGAVTTNNRTIADWIRQFRHHGIQKDPRHFYNEGPFEAYHQELQFPGMNYRLSEIHAALGRSQLTRLDRHIERRRSIAQVYYQKLGNIEELKLPHVADWADSAFHIFPIQFVGCLEEQRDKIFRHLRNNNIEVQVHYVPVHRMPLYAGKLGNPENFPNAEAYFKRALTLPLFPDLSYKDLERITDILIKFVTKLLGELKVTSEDEKTKPVLDEKDTDEDYQEDQAELDFDDNYGEDIDDDSDDDDDYDMDDSDDEEMNDDDSDDDDDDDDDDSDDMDEDDDEEPVKPLTSEVAAGRLRTVPKSEPESDELEVEKVEAKKSTPAPAKEKQEKAEPNETAKESAESDEDAPKKPQRRPRPRGGTRPRRTTRSRPKAGSSDEEKPKTPAARRGRPRRTTKKDDNKGDKGSSES